MDRSTKKKGFIGLGILVLLAVVAVSVVESRGGDEGAEVYVEEAVERDISRIVSASGQVDPRVKVNVSAHVVAKIEELFVEEGDLVERGEPFLTLEQEAFRSVAERARAQLEIARSRLREAEVDLADAELKRERYLRLEEEGIVSGERLEEAELRRQSARLRVEQAQEAVQQARADLAKAEDDLEKTTLYAPLSGRVVELNAEEGEVVVSGTMHNPASVIGVVADLSEILVEVDVDETEIVHVEEGQPAEVTVDAILDATFTGTVTEIASSGFSRQQQPDVTYFKVKILLDEPDPRLRPGMSARAEIIVATREDTVVVPIQAVVLRRLDSVDEDADEGDGGRPDEERIVFVFDDGTAERQAVEVGITDTTHAEILGGLEPETPVITGPSRELKNLEDGDAARRKRAETGENEDEDG